MVKANDTARIDVYERITNAIIAQLEAGTQPWMQPWIGGAPARRPLRHNGVPYSGINTILLWIAAAERGYGSPFWMTYKQATEIGAQVRKGEKASTVVYAGAIQRKDESEDENQIRDRIHFLKSYSVFNADQIEGLPAHYYAKPEAPAALPPKERLPHVDAFFANLGADIREGGNKAFYRPSEDYIQIPHFQDFLSAEAHAATLAHECIHWTTHSSRLDRDFGSKTEGYAREELVALS